ncbi:MAG: CvpA family protein [Christensenellales bacterium]|jgi:uncharacterized membrane protein required for colicin V production|nr:CvpA family protein [Christensenellaceae bacterium]
MNEIDIAILFVIGMSLIYGLYYGFVQTVGSLVAVVVSVLLAFWLGPIVASLAMGNTTISESLASVTDAFARVGDWDLANTQVTSLTEGITETVIQSVKLPDGISDILRNNLNSRSFAGEGILTVNDYVSKTIVSVSFEILGFIIAFALSYAVISIVLSIIRQVFKFPVLRQLDTLIGGAFGLLRGGAIVALLTLLIPLLDTVIPQNAFEAYLETSTLLPYFTNLGVFIKIATGGV